MLTAQRRLLYRSVSFSLFRLPTPFSSETLLERCIILFSSFSLSLSLSLSFYSYLLPSTRAFPSACLFLRTRAISRNKNVAPSLRRSKFVVTKIRFIARRRASRRATAEVDFSPGLRSAGLKVAAERRAKLDHCRIFMRLLAHARARALRVTLN